MIRFKLKIVVAGIWIIGSITSCKEERKTPASAAPLPTTTSRIADSIALAKKEELEAVRLLQEKEAKRLAKQKVQRTALDTLPVTTFVNLEELSDDFMYELKYATKDNFLKQSVYDCPKCYVRVPTAKALLKANAVFLKVGRKIKFFDCYRPHSVQKKMWKIFPNPHYLARPTKGSIHNKGGAVDITLTDLKGNELDMGTGFDHFGKEAHHAYTNLSDTVLENRKLLRETMKKHGFWTIRTEWWHYNYRGASKNALADFKWECE